MKNDRKNPMILELEWQVSVESLSNTSDYYLAKK